VTEPRLHIVIVAYRCRERLRQCLDSLERYPPRRASRTTVVDNGSQDGTVELVRSSFPSVSVFAAGENLGFARAVNLGIREWDAEYILVLNPDTRISPAALDALIDLMEEHDEVGIAGPRLVREDGSFDHAAKRSFPTPIGALGHFLILGRYLNSGPLAQYRAPVVERGRVDAVNGAFMLIRSKALDEVGLFDEGYWMYMEDLDLCYRFSRAGWTSWYEPSVEVVHVKGASSGRYRSPRLNYAFHYGMFRFYRKHYASDGNAAFNALVYVAIGAKLVSSIARSFVGRSIPARPSCASALADRGGQ
jgi:N-acetylglucosaminyl-diphospho-decaprenol L-rhamnosyltransferase